MYLKRRFDGWSGRFSFYKVERETECFYFVRYNDKCVEKIYKKHVGVGHEWSIPTEKDFQTYRIRCLANKLEKLIKATDFEKWSEEKLEKMILIFEEKSVDKII